MNGGHAKAWMSCTQITVVFIGAKKAMLDVLDAMKCRNHLNTATVLIKFGL